MRTARRRRRHLSITSLIDVIFLLLLFFMLASTFTRFAELEVGATANAQSSSASDEPPIQLVLEPRRLILDGEELPTSSLQSAVKRKLQDQSQLSLQVAQGVSSQRLADVLIALEPIDGLQVSMVSMP